MNPLKNFGTLALIGLVLTTGLGSSNEAWARKKKRKKDSPAPALEIYSATESDGPVTARAMPVSPTTIEERKATAPAIAVTAAPAPKKKKDVPFDAVPSEQTDAIVRRLDLVYQLIHDYGRAYDYRALTVRQLEAILKDLEESEVQVPPPVDSG